ncbi:MAG: hypothetical protein PHF74_00645 [Dehalococcoidales bacterium]|nr:hypothetical protein [Dehalococcoidales bacterium]
MVDCSLLSSEANSTPFIRPQPPISDIKPAKGTIPSALAIAKNVKPESASVNEPDVNTKPETIKESDKAIKEDLPVKARTEISEHSNKLEYLSTNWKNVIEHAPDNVKRSPALAILRSAGVKPVAFDDNIVVLSFRFPVHKDKIEESENNKIAAKIIGNFIGHACEVRCIYEPEENHLVREIQKIGGQIVEVEEKWT